ncbi:tripartite tricarboxylate transporter TctB family protein [Ramlibacter sp. G-1-2-2]|uniref:Tripartite tricarboxylate transporter TctB family protein n=1 Tax=Ramlibacter agri TaxID=2728837 RepID=A0A848HEQ3_9BURK|nr:tripartite tricarboxylate transporter TctB family protein [Ramlibacter agri]NML47013.1 tripartite tricarboxylate transporter TctB family protein [Ramlibacter agri]
MALSLTFGLTALKYPIGDLSRAGPGLFPAVISSMLLLIGIAIVIRSRFVEKVPLGVHWKNICIILGALCAFAVVTLLINMLLAIIVMVFIATLAGTSYSWKRNVKICIGLCAMAFVFAKLLGMNLPLY